MPTVSQRAAARNDLVEHFVYLAENAGLNVAERFLANAEASFNDLAEQPKMGAQLKLKNPALSGIQKWRVKDFDNHLIFYVPRCIKKQQGRLNTWLSFRSASTGRVPSVAC
jgi:toxin ParE1/3/4